VQGRDSRAVIRDVEAALKNVDFTLEYHAEMWAISPRGRQPAKHNHCRDHCPGWDIPPAASLLQELAPGAGAPLISACRAGGGVLAIFLGTGGTLPLVSLAGFFTILAYSTQRLDVDQPLCAS